MLQKILDFIKAPDGRIRQWIYARPLDATSWLTHFLIVHAATLIGVGLVPDPWGSLAAMAVLLLYGVREVLWGDDTVDTMADLVFAVYGFISAVLMLSG